MPRPLFFYRSWLLCDSVNSWYIDGCVKMESSGGSIFVSLEYMHPAYELYVLHCHQSLKFQRRLRNVRLLDGTTIQTCFLVTVRKNPDDYRRDRQLRERGPEALPQDGHRGDPHILARREEAGRHAPRVPGEVPGRRGQDQVLHRRCAQPRERPLRDAGHGLHLPCRRTQAGPQLRVLPDGNFPLRFN